MNLHKSTLVVSSLSYGQIVPRVRCIDSRKISEIWFPSKSRRLFGAHCVRDEWNLSHTLHTETPDFYGAQDKCTVPFLPGMRGVHTPGSFPRKNMCCVVAAQPVQSPKVSAEQNKRTLLLDIGVFGGVLGHTLTRTHTHTHAHRNDRSRRGTSVAYFISPTTTFFT